MKRLTSRPLTVEDRGVGEVVGVEDGTGVGEGRTQEPCVNPLYPESIRVSGEVVRSWTSK